MLENKPMLSDAKYTFLKYLTTVVLPAVSALYFALAQMWSLPKAEEVMGTIASLATFLGVLLGVSTKSYNKSDAKYAGTIVIDDTDDGSKYLLNFDGDPRGIVLLRDVVSKVNGSK
jgi:hypothetical protein